MPLPLTIRTHASAPQTLIPGEGVLIPASGASETFTDERRIARLQTDPSLRALLTDNAYGTGASTLILVDTGGTDVPQGLIDGFLASALDPMPGRVARHSTNKNLVFVGFTDTAGALDSDPNWQIYRYNISANKRVFADGNTLYDNVWDSGSSPPTYETHSYDWYEDRVEPHVPNVVFAWEFKEESGVIAQDSGPNDNDGTHTNGPTIAQPADHPLSTYSVSYNGISSRTLSANGLFTWGEDDHTVGFRFRSDGISSRVQFYSPGAGSGYCSCLIAADEDFEWRFFDGTTLHQFVVVGDYHDGLWHDAVFRIDYTGAGELELWIDGTSVGSVSIVANPTTDTGQAWFGDGDFLAAHQGPLELCVIFDKALSDAECAGLYA